MKPLLRNLKNAVLNAISAATQISGFITVVVNFDTDSAIAELTQGDRKQIDMLHPSEGMFWVEIHKGLSNHTLATEIVFRQLLDILPDTLRGYGMAESYVDQLGINSHEFLESELHKMRRLSAQASIAGSPIEETWFDRRFTDTRIRILTTIEHDHDVAYN